MALASRPPYSTIRLTLSVMLASVTWNGRLPLVSAVRYSGIVSSKPWVSVSILPPFGLASRIDCAAPLASFSAASTALVVAYMKRLTRSALALTNSVLATTPEQTMLMP